jgi:branched-chain amino acid transport system permease protein
MRKLHIPSWIGAGILAIAASAFATNPYTISLINLAAIAALTAASMRFVMLIGEVSFATAAFVGIGAYGAGVATTIFEWPFAVALFAGPLVVVVVSVLFGITTLRVRGPYFMLIGFAFAEAVRIVFSKTEFIGGTSGMTGIFPPQFMGSWVQSFVVGTVAVTLFVLYAVERTDFGKVLVSIRDNENIARTVGINVLFCKVACFAIASFCAGIAGSLQAFVNNVISPGDFSFMLASMALAYVKVGGESSIFGAISGAVILVLVGSFALGLGAGEQLFYGAAIVIAVLLMPQGLSGLLKKFVRKVPRVQLGNDVSLEQKAARKLSSNGG